MFGWGWARRLEVDLLDVAVSAAFTGRKKSGEFLPLVWSGSVPLEKNLLVAFLSPRYLLPFVVLADALSLTGVAEARAFFEGRSNLGDC